MFLVDEATAAASLPAMVVKSSPGYFTKGDPTTATPATIVPDDWLNMVQAEMKSVLTAAGMSPDQTKVNLGQLATAIEALITTALTGELKYRGTWNAATNSPALASGVGTTGYFYKVATAGTTSIDGKAVWNVGDMILFDGTVWDKIDGTTTEVISFNGRYGAVSLSSGDVTGALSYVPVNPAALGSAAYASTSSFDGAGAAASAYSSAVSTAEGYADTYKLAKSANLSDLASIGTALGNLGFTGSIGVASTTLPSSGGNTEINKWGIVSSSGTGGEDLFNFPVAFPTACLTAMCCYISSSVPSPGALGIRPITGNPAQFYIQDSSSGAHGIIWWAKGY